MPRVIERVHRSREQEEVKHTTWFLSWGLEEMQHTERSLISLFQFPSSGFLLPRIHYRIGTGPIIEGPRVKGIVLPTIGVRVVAGVGIGRGAEVDLENGRAEVGGCVRVRE